MMELCRALLPLPWVTTAGPERVAPASVTSALALVDKSHHGLVVAQ